jgi:hypothetical protein
MFEVSQGCTYFGTTSALGGSVANVRRMVADFQRSAKMDKGTSANGTTSESARCVLRPSLAAKVIKTSVEGVAIGAAH